jgi:hypothetical protein
VVWTGAGGIPFIYEDRATALLVPPGDWAGLTAAVEDLLQSRSLAGRLIAGGVEVARTGEWKRSRQSLYRSYGFWQPEIQPRSAME